jgi:magnesium transporter
VHYAHAVLVDDATYVNGKRVDAASASQVGAFQWVGLLGSSMTELQKYQQRFNFSDLAVEDALSGRQRPKLDVYENQVLIVLKTVSYDEKTQHISVGDLTLFVGPDFLLTVRHGEALPLRSVRADLEQHPEKLQSGPTSVVHEIIDRLVDQYVEVATKLAEDVEKIEDDVFDDETPAPASRMYFVKRELIEFSRAILPLVEPLNQLTKGAVPHINPASAPLFSDVRDHLLKVIDEAQALNEIMEAALHANLALIQVKQNEDMRKISAYVGIGAVPTMVAGIYGMNFKHLPELEWRYGYFIVMGALALVSFTMFRVFRRNKWL